MEVLVALEDGVRKDAHDLQRAPFYLTFSIMPLSTVRL
jgi:hypothetical protein